MKEFNDSVDEFFCLFDMVVVSASTAGAVLKYVDRAPVDSCPAAARLCAIGLVLKLPAFTHKACHDKPRV